MKPPDLSRYVGMWSGTWRTWVVPLVLHDESPITGEIRALLGGRDLLYTYTATIGGESVSGTALIGPRQGGGATVAWVDSWHTSGLVMCSHGEWSGAGLEVSNAYRAEDADWEWTTRMAIEAGRLVVYHWNQGPSLPKYLGVGGVLERA